jgi:hypothetical protein
VTLSPFLQKNPLSGRYNSCSRGFGILDWNFK